MKNVSIKDVSLRKTIVEVLDEIDHKLCDACDSAIALYDSDGKGMFDVPGAGTVLLTCESMIFTLRAIMFTVVNNNLGEDLQGHVIDLVDDVIELRNLVADSLDEILDDTDTIIEDTLSDLASAYTVYVPADAEVDIDGEPINLSDYADEEENGMIPLDLMEGEELAVNGCLIDTSECEPGEEYDICDSDDNGDVADKEDGGIVLPDDSFLLWVPGGANILWDGEVWTPNEENLNKDIGLVVGTDTELCINGDEIDMSDCEPGEEYRLDSGLVVPMGSFWMRIPFGSDIELDSQTLELDDNDNDGGYVNLLLTSDAVLFVDGALVNVADCEPGGEYELSVDDDA